MGYWLWAIGYWLNAHRSSQLLPAISHSANPTTTHCSELCVTELFRPSFANSQ